jgi:hypothetical protein
MARGIPWTDTEIKLLNEMAASGLTLQQIYDSGKLPGRTFQAILKRQLHDYPIGSNSSSAIVSTVEPSKDTLKMEEVVKRFSTAFEQICGLEKVDKVMLERFRIIFQAAKDYGPLLAHYEKWERIEKQIEELSAAVAELRAAKGVKKV